MAKETVTSLVDLVAAGKMSAAEAGERIRALKTPWVSPKTEQERIDRFNEGGYDGDPNSFIVVESRAVFGHITHEDYVIIYNAQRK